MFIHIIKRIKGNNRLILKLILIIILVPVGFFAFLYGFAMLMQNKVYEAISIIGVLLLGLTILAIVRIAKCNEPVTAVFKGHSLIGNNWKYALVFSYKYEAQQYNDRETVDHYSKQKIKKMFEENNEYTIWINPNKPERCVFNKKRAILPCCALLLFSIVFIVLPVFI